MPRRARAICIAFLVAFGATLATMARIKKRTHTHRGTWGPL